MVFLCCGCGKRVETPDKVFLLPYVEYNSDETLYSMACSMACAQSAKELRIHWAKEYVSLLESVAIKEVNASDL